MINIESDNNVSTIWLIVVLMIAYMYFSNKHDVSDNTPEKLYMINIGTEDDPIYIDSVIM